MGQVLGRTPRDRVTSEMARQVYDLLIEGRSNEEIARNVGLTVRTTKYHISRILDANGLRNRIELIAAHGQAIHGKKRIDGLRRRIESERQRQVYDLTVAGRNGPQIAKKLGISPRTVKFHHQAILETVGADTQARLVASHWGTARRGRTYGRRKRGRSVETDAIARDVEAALTELKQQRERVDEMIDALTAALDALS